MRNDRRQTKTGILINKNGNPQPHLRRGLYDIKNKYKLIRIKYQR